MLLFVALLLFVELLFDELLLLLVFEFEFELSTSTIAPPLEDEELVEPPLEVDEITMLPLDPPLPPKPPPKPPPNPPPPKKPPPPMTAGTAPPPPPMKPSPIAAGIGTGGALATVTIAGGQVVVVVVVTIRRRGAREATSVRLTIRLATLCFTVFCLTTAARGRSATCTAPPPITAPPHAQAQSFAKAIRTDMIFSSLLPRDDLRRFGSIAMRDC